MIPLFLVSGLLHAYVGWRIGPALAAVSGAEWALSLLLAASAVLVPMGLVGRRFAKPPTSDVLTWLGLLCMGLISSLFVLTLLRDVLLLVADMLQWMWPAALPDVLAPENLPVWSAAAALPLGIGVTAYGVLSRGLISESALEGGSISGFRAHSPRFQGDNLNKNLDLVRALKAISDEKGCSVAQLAIAWVAQRGDDIVPLIGARKRVRLAEALGALDITLTPEELKRIDAAAPPEAVAGTRYAPEQMAMLDSER